MLEPSELLEFCNELRQAGGAEELTELLPGVAGSPRECLVAVNLNFACAVRVTFQQGRQGVGYIESDDKRLEQAAAQLGLHPIRDAVWLFRKYGFELPLSIAKAAHDFDAHLYPKALYREEAGNPCSNPYFQ